MFEGSYKTAFAAVQGFTSWMVSVSACVKDVAPVWAAFKTSIALVTVTVKADPASDSVVVTIVRPGEETPSVM